MSNFGGFFDNYLQSASLCCAQTGLTPPYSGGLTDEDFFAPIGSTYMKGLDTRKTKRCSYCVIYSKIPINIEFQHYARHRFFIYSHGFPRKNYRQDAMFIEVMPDRASAMFR
ncbi:Protein CBG15045 [Caenorhabditis briggsae]|uniref:Protein CBG15045 n=1 Tax=Caenorhabditis briggsae TaxID=6238 RepID=A8XL98_CAEBR|nr:Protein CBG15045 [Caenorhabditis briggsae]CAP33423.2 Protein CBG15045 [Caenorhabditis briggsae]